MTATMYSESFLDRHENPRFHGRLAGHDISCEAENPLCGDRLRVELRLDDRGLVTDAAYSGHGCAVSEVAADMLMESAVGLDIEALQTLAPQDVLGLLGMELGQARMKCALLPLSALQRGLKTFTESAEPAAAGWPSGCRTLAITESGR